MRVASTSGVRKFRGLKNIAWLTPRQLKRLADALTTSRVEKRGIIFDEKSSPDAAYVLLSGVARIACTNRSGARSLVIMVAPGMIPGVPAAFAGVRTGFAAKRSPSVKSGPSHWTLS